MKYHIEKNTVQETLVIPLFGRLVCSERFPEPFRMGSCSYDKENGIIRYSFTQCPNAEFAKRHQMEVVLPVLL